LAQLDPNPKGGWGGTVADEVYWDENGFPPPPPTHLLRPKIVGPGMGGSPSDSELDVRTRVYVCCIVVVLLCVRVRLVLVCVGVWAVCWWLLTW